jgi:hypothetical protein
VVPVQQSNTANTALHRDHATHSSVNDQVILDFPAWGTASSRKHSDDATTFPSATIVSFVAWRADSTAPQPFKLILPKTRRVIRVITVKLGQLKATSPRGDSDCRRFGPVIFGRRLVVPQSPCDPHNPFLFT